MLKFLNSGILTTSYTDIYLSSLKEDVNDPFGHDGDWVRQGAKMAKRVLYIPGGSKLMMVVSTGTSPHPRQLVVRALSTRGLMNQLMR